VDQGSEAQRPTPGEVVGERFRQQRCHVGGPLTREALQVALDLEQLREHGEGVSVHVEVVVGALLDSAQRLQLGEHAGCHPQRVHQLQPAQWIGTFQELAELGELALAGRLARSRSRAAGKLHGCVVELQPQLGGDPGGSQKPQRVGGEALLAYNAEPACGEVGEPAVGIDRRAATQWHGDRSHGEVARGEVPLDGLAAQGGEVDPPRLVSAHDPPGRERRGELERMAAAGPGEPLCRLRHGAGERHVEVGDLTPERRVADGAANDPGLLGAQGRSRDPDHRGGSEPVGERGGLQYPGQPASTRGTRAEMPQVTS
jgi:hypothetical protein